MSEGVTTHYLPVRSVLGKKYEKGIDVWLALEAFEMAFYKRFDILVLIAADGDYVPLVRKLNTLGTRVLVLGWDFEYTDEEGNRFFTRTSQDLLSEVTYPVAMHDVINGKNEALINQLFVARNKVKSLPKNDETLPIEVDSEEGVQADENSVPTIELNAQNRHESTILSLKEGFGFIKFPPNNVFFHYTSLRGFDFNELSVGDRVQFTLEEKDSGRAVGYDVFVLDALQQTP
jgi:cold shock CspA family protein